MRSLRKLTILAIGLGVSVNAFANWITMYHINDFSNTNFASSFVTCKYSENLFGNGEIISIRVSGSYCPSSIQYNPERNTWRR